MAGIRKKFFFQLIYAFSQLAFPLLTYPYITRQLGAEGLGRVGYVEYLSGFVITLASFGIPFYGVREIARVRDDEQKKNALLRRLFSFHLLVSLIGCAVFVALLKTNARQEIPFAFLLLGCINIMLPAFMVEWYMQGIEAFAYTTIRSIILRLLGLIAFFLFVREQQDDVIYFLIIVLVQAAVALSNMVKIGFGNFRPKMDREAFPLGSLWHFFLTTTIISVYVFFDVLILGWVANEAQVGYYAVAVRIIKLSLLLVLSLNVILFPRISFLTTKKENEAELRQLMQKAMQFMLLLTLPLFVGFYCLAPQVVLLLAGDDFQSSITLVQILSGLPLVIGFSNLFVYQVLTPFGKERQLLLCVGITCACSLFLHLVLAQQWLERGTAWATLATELIMALLTAFFARRTFPLRFPLSSLYQGCLSILPLVFIAMVCRHYLDNPFAILSISLGLGISLYTVIQLAVFKNAVLLAVWKDVKKWNGRLTNG